VSAITDPDNGQDDPAARLSAAAAIYRYEGEIATAVKIEAVLSRLDWNRPVRVADLEAAEVLANAVLPPAEVLDQVIPQCDLDPH